MKNSIKVTIKNYESIGYAELEISGFTTLLGRNALGKSSSLRAIDAALTNKSGMDFIKWGEKFCEVTIKTEGLDLLWHKEQGNNFYVINNKTYKKIGRDTPPTQVSDAGFKVVKVGTEKINLNYAEQFNPLFLVDRNDTKTADLITSIYGLDKLYKAISLCNIEQRDNRDQLRIREKDLEIANKDLDRYKDFDSIEKGVSDLGDLKRTYEEKESNLDIIQQYYDTLETLIRELNSLKKIKEIVIPSSDNLENLNKCYVELNTYLNEYNNLNKEIQKLSKVKDLEVPKEGTSISELITSYTNVGRMHTQYSNLLMECEKLKIVQGIKLPEDPRSPEDTDRLDKYYKNLINLKDELLGIRADLKRAKEEKKLIEKELSSFSMCPLCGSEITEQVS